MATTLLRYTFVAFLLATVGAEPSPGRIPKVYNALITSNQNLEPSKAYPVYQPVLHNTFPFPFHTVYYGDYPVGNSLLPLPGLLPKVPNPPAAPASPSTEAPKEGEPSTEAPQPAEPPQEANPQPEAPENVTPAPPPPPKTESPIPLNEFGLPPQVLPIGRLGPSYDFTHFGSFPYTYPGFRFYDPYDPFGFSPYGGLPLYRPITNILGQSAPVVLQERQEESPKPAQAPPSQQETQPPPAEPSDLNVLNYSAKDPAIPNVPPPPLPSGGLKSDKSE